MTGASFRALARVLGSLTSAALAAVTGVDASAVELGPYRIVGLEIPEPLTEAPGDPARGEQVVRAANATCLICHVLPIPDEPDPGNIGPPLAGVGSRYTPGELRLRLVDPKVINPDTPMPGYHKVEGLHRVLGEYLGKPIYSAQDIEDVVAYLLTLTDP